MKIEKLELRFLAGYLPYGLKALGNCNYHTIIGFKNETYFIEGGNNYAYGDIADFKPILRPLSDLTKEIEVNGSKFVPIVELVKISDPFFRTVKDILSKGVVHGIRYFDETSNCIVFNYSRDTSSFTTFENDLKTTFITQKQLELFEKLYEWHFDVHGLIESGLAIDINTL